jgi:RNA polymerase sigma factor (sigma-70 family)
VGTLNDTLEKFYRENRQQLFTYAAAITRCPGRAEDAIQEAFARLFQLRKKPRHLKAYVFRAVRNAAIDQIRRNPVPAGEVSEFIFDPNGDPRDKAEQRELRHDLAQALLSLSENERETIVQHVYADLPFREIARIRESPMGTVTAWYRRGLRKLQSQMETRDEESGRRTQTAALAGPVKRS